MDRDQREPSTVPLLERPVEFTMQRADSGHIFGDKRGATRVRTARTRTGESDLRERELDAHRDVFDDGDAVHAPAVFEIVTMRLRPPEESPRASHDEQRTSQNEEPDDRERGTGEIEGGGDTEPTAARRRAGDKQLIIIVESTSV